MGVKRQRSAKSREQMVPRAPSLPPPPPPPPTSPPPPGAAVSNAADAGDLAALHAAENGIGSTSARTCIDLNKSAVVRRFVPRVVVERFSEEMYLEKNEANLEEIAGVVAFFDISGFSKLANDLKIEEQRETQNQTDLITAGIRLSTFPVGSSASNLGPLAPSSERLAEILNHTLSGLVNYILMSGGDIIKFAGDALIAIWRSSLQEVSSMAAVACHTALKCTALTSSSKSSLHLHTGIGCGQLILGHVGGQLDRWEFFIAGDANAQAAAAQEASSSDQVVISSIAMEQLSVLSGLKPQPIEMECYPQKDHAGFYQVRMVKLLHGNYKFPDKINLAAEAANPMESRVLGLASAYIPRPVMRMIENRSANVDELRKVSVIFFHLMEPLDAPSPREELLRTYSSASLAETLDNESSPSSPVNAAACLQKPPAGPETPNNEEPRLLDSDSSAAGPMLGHVEPPPLDLNGSPNANARRLKRPALSIDTSVDAAGSGAAQSERQRALDVFLHSVQERVKAVQRAAYSQWGTLRQFIIDDKGCVAIVVMGLPPHYFEDNAARAVKIAANLIHSQGVQATAGICSGTVFCGAIGSEYRAEYSVTGECINLAARLMGKARPNSALCDTQTYKEAKSSYNFNFTKVSHELKGYEQSVTAYAPGLAAIAEKKTLKQGILGAGTRASPNQGSILGHDWVTIGQEGPKADLCRAAFLDRLRPCKAILLEGPPGAGKSHLLSWVSNVANRKTVEIFFNVAEVSECKTPFSVWKAIVQEMLKLAPKDLPDTPGTTLGADRDASGTLSASRLSTLSSTMAIASPSEAAAAISSDAGLSALESPGLGPAHSLTSPASAFTQGMSRTSSMSSIRRTGMRGLFGSSAASAATAGDAHTPEPDVSGLQSLSVISPNAITSAGPTPSGTSLVKRTSSNFMAMRSSASADMTYGGPAPGRAVERRRLSSKSRSTPKPSNSARSRSFQATDEERAALAQALGSPGSGPLHLADLGAYAGAAVNGGATIGQQPQQQAGNVGNVGALAKISQTVGQVGQVLQRSLSMDVTARRIRKRSPIPTHASALSADAGMPGQSAFPEPLMLGQGQGLAGTELPSRHWSLDATPSSPVTGPILSSTTSVHGSEDVSAPAVLDERMPTPVLNSYTEEPNEEEDEEEDEEDLTVGNGHSARRATRVGAEDEDEDADADDDDDDHDDDDNDSEGDNSMVFVQSSKPGLDVNGGKYSRRESPVSMDSSPGEPGPINLAAASPLSNYYPDLPVSASCNNMDEFVLPGDNEIEVAETIFRTTSMGRPASMPRSILPMPSPHNRVRTGSGQYSGFRGGPPPYSTTGNRFLQVSAQSGDHKLIEGSPMLARLRDNGHLRGRRLSSLGHLLPGFVFASADGAASAATPATGASTGVPHPLGRNASLDRIGMGTMRTPQGGDDDVASQSGGLAPSGHTGPVHRHRVLSDSSEGGMFNSLRHTPRHAMLRRASPTPTHQAVLSPTSASRLSHRLSDADVESRGARSSDALLDAATRGLHSRRGSGTLRPADCEDIIEIVLALLDEIGKRGPVVVIIDDAQNLDSASWELLKRAVKHGMEVTARLQEEALEAGGKGATQPRTVPGPSVRFIVAYRTLQASEQSNEHWLELIDLCEREAERVARMQPSAQHEFDPVATADGVDDGDGDGVALAAATLDGKAEPSLDDSGPAQQTLPPEEDAGAAKGGTPRLAPEQATMAAHGDDDDQEDDTPSMEERSSDESESIGNERVVQEGKLVRPAWCLVSRTAPLTLKDAANFLTSNRAVGVGSDLLKFLYDSTKGNPGYLLNLFNSLVERGFIRINQLTGVAHVMDGLRNMTPENLLLMSLPAHFVAEVYSRWDNLSMNVLLILKMASVVGKVVLLDLLFDVYTKKNQLMRVASADPPTATAAAIAAVASKSGGLRSPLEGIQSNLRREDSIAELPPQSDASAEYAAASGATANGKARPGVLRSLTDRPVASRSVGAEAEAHMAQGGRGSVSTHHLMHDSITLSQDTSEELILLARRTQSDNGVRRKTSRFFGRGLSRKLSARSSSGANESPELSVRRSSTNGSLHSLDAEQLAALRAEFFEGIEELKRVGFLVEPTANTAQQGETILFKEDVERSIVYDLMPNKEKRLIHQYILEWYEEEPERIDVAFPTGYDIGTLGYHAMLAEEHLKAFSYFEAGIADLSSRQGIRDAELMETLEALSFSLKEISTSEILERQLRQQTKAASVEYLKRFYRCRALIALCRFHVMQESWVDARVCANLTVQTSRFARVALLKRESTLGKLLRHVRSIGGSRPARNGNWMRLHLASVHDKSILQETVKCGDQAKRLLLRIAAMNYKVKAMIRNIDDFTMEMM